MISKQNGLFERGALKRPSLPDKRCFSYIQVWQRFFVFFYIETLKPICINTKITNWEHKKYTHHRWLCHRVPCGPLRPAWSTREPHVCSLGYGSMSGPRLVLGNELRDNCGCEDTGSSTADTDVPIWSCWLSLCSLPHCCCNTCDLGGKYSGVNYLSRTNSE